MRPPLRSDWIQGVRDRETTGRFDCSALHRPGSSRKASANCPFTASRSRAGSKISGVIGALERGSGATIDEIVAATGWLPHTARAALTGLRKRGYGCASGSLDRRGTVAWDRAHGNCHDAGAPRQKSISWAMKQELWPRSDGTNPKQTPSLETEVFGQRLRPRSRAKGRQTRKMAAVDRTRPI